jgi:hypothetical protein
MSFKLAFRARTGTRGFFKESQENRVFERYQNRLINYSLLIHVGTYLNRKPVPASSSVTSGSSDASHHINNSVSLHPLGMHMFSFTDPKLRIPVSSGNSCAKTLQAKFWIAAESLRSCGWMQPGDHRSMLTKTFA